MEMKRDVLFLAFLFALATAISAERISKLSVIVKNGCNQTIWPTMTGKLEPGENQTVTMQNPNSGNADEPVTVSSIWPKTGCQNLTDGTACATGECRDQLCSWNFPDTTPATSVDFGLTFGYLHVDFATTAGFNLGAEVALDGNSVLTCQVDLAECPSSNVVTVDGTAVGCGRSPDARAFDSLLQKRCPVALNGVKKPSLVDNAVYTLTFCP